MSSRYGASGVWVGTRFVASEEAGAPPKHKEMVLSAGYDEIIRTLVYSGRPMSVRKTPYLAEWSVSIFILIYLIQDDVYMISYVRVGRALDDVKSKNWFHKARFHIKSNWRSIQKNRWLDENVRIDVSGVPQNDTHAHE